MQYKALEGRNHKKSIIGIEDFLNKENLSAETESLKEYSEFLAIITDNFEDITYIVSLLEHYPKLAKQTKIDETSVRTFVDNELLRISDLEYSKFVRYLGLQHKTKRILQIFHH